MPGVLTKPPDTNLFKKIVLQQQYSVQSIFCSFPGGFVTYWTTSPDGSNSSPIKAITWARMGGHISGKALSADLSSKRSCEQPPHTHRGRS